MLSQILDTPMIDGWWSSGAADGVGFSQIQGTWFDPEPHVHMGFHTGSPTDKDTSCQSTFSQAYRIRKKV